MSAATHVVATWVESTACGTQYETLTADDRVHILGRPRSVNRGKSDWWGGDQGGPVTGSGTVPPDPA